MSEEEKEQWLYDAYKYTSNFDFNRLDEYEEANRVLCIDDLILDYTMLYEHYKKEIERLENIIKEVREYIKSNEFIGKIKLTNNTKEAINQLLEILDKENKQ